MAQEANLNFRIEELERRIKHDAEMILQFQGLGENEIAKFYERRKKQDIDELRALINEAK